MNATRHTFITDLFEMDQPCKFDFRTLEEVAQDIASGSFLPHTVHECEEPSICNDVTADVAQRVRDLCEGEYRQHWNLLNWLQKNGAVSISVRAA